jgi:hypothetical protein
VHTEKDYATAYQESRREIQANVWMPSVHHIQGYVFLSSALAEEVYLTTSNQDQRHAT